MDNRFTYDGNEFNENGFKRNFWRRYGGIIFFGSIALGIMFGAGTAFKNWHAWDSFSTKRTAMLTDWCKKKNPQYIVINEQGTNNGEGWGWRGLCGIQANGIKYAKAETDELTVTP